MEINSKQNTNEDILEVPRKGVHTLNQDIGHAAETGSPGTIKAIIDATEGKEIEKEKSRASYSVNQLYMIFGFIALLLSFGLIYYFMFFIAKNNNTDIQFPQSIKSMFTADKISSIEIVGLSKVKVLKTLYDEYQKVVLPEGQIQNFTIVENGVQVSLGRFLQIIEANVALPEGNIFSQEFIFGVFSSSGNHPFFVLKVKNMNDAFSTMSIWEKKMLYDLGQIFNYEISPNNKYLLTKDFSDGVVQNKNARVLYDEFGSAILMYVYLDDTTILITNFGNTAGEIIERKSSSNIRK